MASVSFNLDKAEDISNYQIAVEGRLEEEVWRLPGSQYVIDELSTKEIAYSLEGEGEGTGDVKFTVQVVTGHEVPPLTN